MHITRRIFCRNTLGAGLALGVARNGEGFGEMFQGSRPTYLNPVLSGDHADAGAIRVGDDFFLTHSSFDYAPGLPIWHSKDLVNWTSLVPHSRTTTAASGRRIYASTKVITTSTSPAIINCMWCTPRIRSGRGANRPIL